MRTSPLAVTATLCLLAAATATTRWRRLDTRRGVGWLSTAYPSWPWRLDPMVKTSPALVQSTVWCLPAATAATWRRPSAPTASGAITAPSPLWIWASGWPAERQGAEDC